MQLKSFILILPLVLSLASPPVFAARGVFPQKKLKLEELSRAPASQKIAPTVRKTDVPAAQVPQPGGYYVPQVVPGNEQSIMYGGSAGQGKMLEEAPAKGSAPTGPNGAGR